MMDAMIGKFNKAGHRLYLLTGKKDKSSSYQHVFARYDFSYDNDSINDIFESIKPELVVFMGAYDTNFDWHKSRQESVRYTAALMNILSAYSMVGKGGRFVYLSSEDVYSDAYTNNVPETEPTSPRGFKALAVAQGEEACENYRKVQGMDTLILRLDHMYCVPHKGQEESSPCFRMCLEALKSGKISASSRNTFSMIFLNDAVELAYKAMTSVSPGSSCYHISSMEEINERQLAELIQKKMGSSVELVDTSVGSNYRLILDAGRFEKDFDRKIFTHYEEGVEQVAQYMKRHSDSFIHAEDAGGGRMGRIWHSTKTVIGRLIPFLETIVCFFPFFLLNNMAAGSEYFSKLDFYLLYVLLFAIIHGQQQAIFSALLAVLGYCVHEMGGRSGFEVLLDHNTYVWMAQLFILGMVVGYMRDQLRQIKKDDAEEILYLNGKLDDIADINDSNVRMKENFEAQVVNQRDSLGKIYEITSSLEGYGPEEVLFYAAQVVSDLMNSKDAAVYTVANRSYARLFSATSAEARKLGSSIEYTAMEEMYSELKEGRVYINRTMADKLPLMACPVYGGEELELILMVWGIPWQRMTLAEANRLDIVGHLIQNAVVRANRYLEALRDQRYVEGTNVLAPDAFTQLVKAFSQAREKNLTECTLLEIRAEKKDLDQAAAKLSGSIRQSDYMGVLEDGKLYILLSNTNAENARGVMERFRSCGYESCPREGAVV